MRDHTAVDDYKVSRIYGSVRRTNPQVTKRGRQGRSSLWLFEQIKEEIAMAPDTVLRIRRQMLGCQVL